MSDPPTIIKWVFPIVALLLGITAMVLLFVGCSDTTLEDLPNNKQDIVQVDVTVYQMPDQFPNIVFFCNGTTGVYLNTRQANSTALLPNDGRCAGAG